MITIGLHKYSRDSYGFGAVSFNTSSLFKMGDVIAILQIYSDPERLTDLPRTIQLENGEIRFEFQVSMVQSLCSLHQPTDFVEMTDK